MGCQCRRQRSNLCHSSGPSQLSLKEWLSECLRPDQAGCGLAKESSFVHQVSITGDPRYESKEEVKKTTGQRKKPGEMEKKDPGFRLQGEKVKEKARSDACIS